MPSYSHITAISVFPVFIDPYMSGAGSSRTRHRSPGGTDSDIYLRRGGRGGKRPGCRHQYDDRQSKEIRFEFHTLVLNWIPLKDKGLNRY
jgi:hypothetical protein